MNAKENLNHQPHTEWRFLTIVIDKRTLASSRAAQTPFL
jgi:hypothetical protein